MSQWNNSYSYNNQYQDGNSWNSDPNGQFANQAYYARQDSSNQYVSFNEFLSQMQNTSATPSGTANFNNVQYENYPSGQYNYQNMPAQAHNTYNYATIPSNIPNEVEAYQQNMQAQYNAMLPDPNLYTNEMILKSNLTPTATEFVPKGSLPVPSTSSQNIPESSSTVNSVNESRNNHGNSSEKNWRQRPQSSQQSIKPAKPESNRYMQDNHRSHDSTSRNRDSNQRNNESNGRNNEFNGRNNESNGRHKESNDRQKESNGCQHEPNSRHYEPNGRNYESGNHNSESSSRMAESSNRNQESNHRNFESSSRSDKRNQSKGNLKLKSKESDARTFYNSSISKDSQDVRNGRGESSGRHRNYIGTQRLKTVDRNIVEDEQYASSYLQPKEEKQERTAKSEHLPSPVRVRNKNSDQAVNSNKEMTQRERLMEQLDKGTLECLVCCERVKQTDPVWSCSNCYHVLHLRCIRKWAISSMVEGKWRCPACQNTNEDIPTEYRCMCGAVRSPEYQRGAGGAHTCGKACKRPRVCPHPCTLLCHPGPCPPCQATVNKRCGCGAETRSVLCSSKLPQVCGRVCARTLLCRVHECARDCHEGLCDTCAETVTQVCYCPAGKSRSVECTAETGASAQWSCGGTCARVLACGAHVCRARCHAPPCAACDLLPGTVLTCPCGKTRLDKDKRKLCTDPIPLCGNICAKPLECGPAGDKHFCKLDCHEGSCPVCPDKTLLQCRCGHSSRDVPCADLPEMYNNVLCQKKCNKKLSCGRHRCRTACCAGGPHRCAAPCGRTLSCQTHRCEEFCHTGHCAPCPRLSFEELSCACGASVALPPVRCGARPPACAAPCRRPRPCRHAPHHSCHSGDCPPCVVLTTKRCHGDHEERKTIPCSQDEFSCGLPCGKPLSCGKHNCIKTCHKGPCDTGKCTQPCNEKRPSCGHPCAAPCHADANTNANANANVCPSAASCRRLVRATCPCARRHAERPCSENARDYAKMMSALAVTKMQESGSVDISEVQRPGSMLKTLECDDECRVEARTRQLALALQIRNPDVSAKLAPRYSDHVRSTAAKEPAFAHQIHDRLTDLVQLAKKSKQKTRSHSFPSMNWQKRQFIHELCEHFGCESVAYDAEPNRNVVATADKEKSWLPAMSVLEVLGREAGRRRVPGPVLRAPPPPAAAAAPSAPGAPASHKSSGGWATLTSTNAWAARSQPKQQPPEAKIDYFDNPPDN